MAATAVLATLTGTTSAGAPPLSKLRVCGHDRVPFTGSECRRDQSGAALMANEFDCSVRIAISRPATLRAQFRYQGALQHQYTEHLGRGSGTRVIGVYFFHTKMPAGRYSCRFTLGGHSLDASFRSSGPAANVLGPSVCLATHRVGSNECRRDEGNAALPATKGITCDAVFARERGRVATVELLDEAGHVVATQQDSLNYPITEAGATFMSGGGAFSPGTYDCSFSVGSARADRRFQISG